MPSVGPRPLPYTDSVKSPWDLIGSAFLILLLSLGGFAGDKPSVPTHRWNPQSAECTFRDGEDGRSYYGLSSGDFEITLAVDRQELEKIPHPAPPILRLFLPFHSKVHP